jgi:AmmeMemoRadiSam system protein B/AmmeMemoRadiSam system protein A
MKLSFFPSALGFVLALGACSGSAVPPSDAPQQPGAKGAAKGTKASGAAKSGVLRSTLAGSAYPAERSLVVTEIQRMLRSASAAPLLSAKPVAVVVPHGRWSESGEAMLAAFQALHPGQYARVVLVGPVHEGDSKGFAVPDVKAYETPLGNVPVCREAAKLVDGKLVHHVPPAEKGEPSLEVELPLLRQRLVSFCVVPVLVGETDVDMEQQFAKKLARLRDGKTLFVFSSDFIRYGERFKFTPFGASPSKARDQIKGLESRALDLLKAKNATGFRNFVESTGATICGWRGLSVMLELLRLIAPGAEPVLLAHYSSSELPDVYDVWYASLAYLPKGSEPPAQTKPIGEPPRPKTLPGDTSALKPDLGQRLVRIARAAVNTELNASNNLQYELSSLPASSALDRQQAAYVRLFVAGQPRGCMGQTESQFWLPEAVVRAALDAALHDPKAKPVKPDELEKLSVEVTLLTPPQSIESRDDIVVGTHGIVLEKDQQRAVLLPQVPKEAGWTLIKTLNTLSRDAGLAARAWRDPDVKLSIFTAQTFREDSRSAPAAAGQNKR